MKLKANQFCPLHRRRNCCGREDVPRFTLRKAGKWEQVRVGVRRIKDEHSPTGYRWKLSQSEKEKVILRKLQQNGGICGICQGAIEDMSDVVPDHIEPKGMGGGFADDGENGSNLQPAHSECNMDKGSRRI
jgi:hypothetical protein